MLKNGEYAAWFRTRLGQGTGRVLLKDGQISGEDAFISYSGTYEVSGSHFTATLTTRRHTVGCATVFGIDEVEIKLTGLTSHNFASCSGELAQMPGLIFEVTLIPAREEDRSRARNREPDAFRPERLPKHKFR
jgi:hypothetical protein